VAALDGGEWSVSRAGRFTPKGKRFRYPLNRRLGGLEGRSGRFGEEIAAGEIRTTGCPFCSVVTILTELFRLHHFCYIRNTFGTLVTKMTASNLYSVLFVYPALLFVCKTYERTFEAEILTLTLQLLTDTFY
jgi:hypothetical protein